MTAVQATDHALDVRGLTVRYGEVAAAEDLTLIADSGEILGLLGPNGAGKTSAIRALTTVVPVSAGTATVAGHDLQDQMAVRSAIGVLPESNGYPGAQTARSYLRFYGELHGMAARETGYRADRQLQQLGLADETGRIATFSRGMRQRLGLARALINDPAVLFLDEPTLGLDPAGQEELLAYLVRSAVENGTCVILCSHLLNEVERICDRVAIMHHARIVAEGRVDDVVDQAGIAGFGKITVAPDDVLSADAAMRRSPVVGSIQFDNTRPGDLEIELAMTNGARADILRVLLDAGIEPRSFDLQGARLNDAFLALTAATRKAAS